MPKKLFQIEETDVVGEVYEDVPYFHLIVLDKATGVTKYRSPDYKTPGRAVNKFYWYLKYHL